MELLDKRFDYTYATKNRFDIPNKIFEINNKKIKIELLVTNGFVKLYTMKGRLYGLQQTQDNHTLPDWKIHLNISNEDISKSWKIITESLLNLIFKYSENKEIIDDLIISMKAFNINLEGYSFPKYMEGREVTIYIYQYDELLNDNNKPIELEDKNEKDEEIKFYYLFKKNEEEKFTFWYELLIDIESKLKNAKIKRKKLNGAADGDLWLGQYSSLRNEAFCFEKKEKDYVYPPNNRGWNSVNQKKPFNWFQIYMIRYSLVYRELIIKNRIYIISFILLFIIFLIYKFK